ncbi:duf614 family protein-related [Anaeramoeba flamelloides]|uniref:Duf614 family protein-related n=1 Tax=Anaeramoeba flamelloides TaxID=1746091 RepID=A0ABQ8X3J1_9EUKA|nr:duf614 family protein-related [Anaeramoeba flamelloides]
MVDKIEKIDIKTSNTRSSFLKIEVSDLWKSGLFSCFEDFNVCICGLVCPALQSAKNKAAIDERNCTICDCLCCPPEFFTRQQIRSSYGFEEALLNDCLTAAICMPCVICQDAREINQRSKK